MDHHEVDVLCSGGFFVASCFLSGGLTVQHIDGRVEPGLRHQRLCGKARQDFTALRGVQVCDHAVQRRCDEQVAVFRGNLIFVHLRDGHTQRRQHRSAVRQIGCGGLGNAALARVGRESESVQLRHHLRADELAGQAGKGHFRGLLIVQRVHIELAAAVVVAFYGLICHGDVALDVPVVAAVVAQPLHAQHRHDQLVGVRALPRQLRSAVQLAGQRRQLVDFVQDGDEGFCQCNVVCHIGLPCLSV